MYELRPPTRSAPQDEMSESEHRRERTVLIAAFAGVAAGAAALVVPGLPVAPRLLAAAAAAFGALAAAKGRLYSRPRIADALAGSAMGLLTGLVSAGLHQHAILYDVAVGGFAVVALLSLVLAWRYLLPLPGLAAVLGLVAATVQLDLPPQLAGGTLAVAFLASGWFYVRHGRHELLLGTLLVGGGALMTTTFERGDAVLGPLAAVIAYWFAVGIAPVSRSPIPWRLDRNRDGQLEDWIARISLLVSTGLCGLLLRQAFHVSHLWTGLLALFVAGLAGILPRGLPASSPTRHLAAEAGSLLAVAAAWMLLPRPQAELATALQALMLVQLVKAGEPRTLLGVALPLGLLSAGLVAVWSLPQAGQPWPPDGAPWRLAVLVCVWAAGRGRFGPDALAYDGAAYAGLLAWLVPVLKPLESGDALLTGAWAVIGVLALGAGFVFEHRPARLAGAGTLALAACKLAFVDLSSTGGGARLAVMVAGGGTLLFWFVGQVRRTFAKPDSGSRWD